MVRALLGGQDLLDIAREWRMGIPKVEACLAPAFAKLSVADAAELRERFTL